MLITPRASNYLKMIKNRTWVKSVSFLFLACFIGCASQYPKTVLRLSPVSLTDKQLQSRQYETDNEKEIIAACAGVLQDLGFTIDDSETQLGLVVGSKDRNAIDAGQVTLATISTIFNILNNAPAGDDLERVDRSQKIRASVVTRPSSDPKKILVRVTFQRLVWNARGEVARRETLKDPSLYQGFFDRLSKSVFLEAQKI